MIAFGATLANAGGRAVVGFGGGLRREGRDVVAFGATLPDAGGRAVVDAVGLGSTLADAGGRHIAGLGSTLADAGGRVVVDAVGFGSTLADVGGRVVVGFGSRPTMLDFSAVVAGAGVLTTAVAGTLADSGMSSQPASTSSAGLAAFWVP